MKQVRYGVYETNSSSSLTFIVPIDGEKEIPSSINLNSSDLSTVDGRIRRFMKYAQLYGVATEFIQYLASRGITIETGSDDDFDTVCDIFGVENVDELDKVLFTRGTDICTYPDDIDNYEIIDTRVE